MLICPGYITASDKKVGQPNLDGACLFDKASAEVVQQDLVIVAFTDSVKTVNLYYLARLYHL